MNLRRLASLFVLCVASLLSVATSQPRPPPGQSVQQFATGTVVLDGQQPTASIHYTARVADVAHAADDAGTPWSADFTASAYPCLVGIDQFDDAGTCFQLDATHARPGLLVTLRSDDGGTADTDAGFGLRLPMFASCPTATACIEGFTLQVALPANETRQVLVRYDVDLLVRGNNLSDGDLLLTQP